MDTAVETTNNISTAGRINEILKTIEPNGNSDFSGVFSQYFSRLNKRKLLVVISDFLADDAQTLEQSIRILQQIRAKRSEIIFLHILDESELSFDFSGVSEFIGLERAGRIIVEPSKIKNKYIEELNKYLDKTSSEMSAAGVKYVLINTAKPVELNILKIFRV